MSQSDSKNSVRSIVSSMVGNILEWYEYTLYAYFASVISALFFPSENHLMAMLMTFATFAVGLAARPVGGLIFGYIGDRYSRKSMLTFTMFLMSIPTMCIGFLPTYESIGMAAPIILVILRITQGIALGGEFGASCVYLYESVPQNKRGFFGSLALTGVGTGLVLSSLTILIVEFLATQEQIYSFAWRIPFFVSVFGSLVAFYMRLHLLESRDFLEAKQQQILVSNPIRELFKSNKKTLMNMFSIFITTQVAFFVVFIFGKTMMIEYLSFDHRTAGLYNLVTVLFYTFSTVGFGYLSDYINKRKIILTGTVLLLASTPLFINALSGGSGTKILTLCILMGLFIGMVESTLNPLVASSFPVAIRATSVAFCWNFTSVTFGGGAPLISMWMIENFGSINAVSFIMGTTCVITIISLLYQLKTEASQIISPSLQNSDSMKEIRKAS
jgi:MHS family proline/betaine transporter-like MFS transporter